MIAYLNGKLVDKAPTEATIDVEGVGYRVNIPLSTFDKLSEKGSLVKILTYLHVREDIQQLYGFATAEEKSLFKLLISVSGIGPKLSLRILSGASITEIESAILNKNVGILTAISGVGKKVAGRIIVELREKIEVTPLLEIESAGELKDDSLINDAVLALVSLGYKQSVARQAIRETVRRLKGEITLEGLTREALRVV